MGSDWVGALIADERSPSTKKTLIKVSRRSFGVEGKGEKAEEQGGQIGQSLAFWEIVYFEKFI
jgi:hypothetical protein